MSLTGTIRSEKMHLTSHLMGRRVVLSFIAEAQTILSNGIKLEDALSGLGNIGGFPLEGVHNKGFLTLVMFIDLYLCGVHPVALLTYTV
jgi:hypothetical protein